MSKKNARVIRANHHEFWTTQREFWKSVREGRVEVLSHSPLTGQVINRVSERVSERNPSGSREPRLPDRQAPRRSDTARCLDEQPAAPRFNSSAPESAV